MSEISTSSISPSSAPGQSAVVLDPLNLPATIAFTPTADGHGIESQPFSDALAATWWHDNGAAALAPYVLQALSALHPVADAAGVTSVGAALDVITATSTPADVTTFVKSYFATAWAESAEANRLLAADATCSEIYAWGTRAEQAHASAAHDVLSQSALALLNTSLGSGQTPWSVLASINEWSQQGGSFTLGLTAPGLSMQGDAKSDVVLGGLGADAIQTLDGRDVVMAFEGDDQISTGDGQDIIWAGSGNDHVDGGPGIDTAMYAGAHASYTVTKTADGYTVAGADGTDTLVNIERIMFSDGTLATDCDGTGGQVYRMYHAAFNRAPDAAGAGYWIGILDAGTPLARIANEFMNTFEYRALYGTDLSNGEFITNCYRNVLHRGFDQNGYDYWLGVLNQGMDSRAGVLANISEGTECQAAITAELQNGYLFTPYG